MARHVLRLTALGAKNLKAAGLHADGGGLYLRIASGTKGGKRWVFIYRRPKDRKRCEIGLGGTSGTAPVSLSDARQRAKAAGELLAKGLDPKEAKATRARVTTFGEVAARHIETMGASWRNPKHRAQWEMSLKDYAAALRGKPVDQIGTADVLEVLTPIWQTIPETASRVRGRIEAVLDAAKAQGLRSGENPAAWRGHLKGLLPARQKLARGHHGAMRWQDVPAFIVALRLRDGLASLALEFLIYTATRSGEVRGACWAEIDIGEGIWTIPAARMKAGKVHRVPLPVRALAILETVTPLRRDDDLIFPGQSIGRPLSDMTLAAVLKRMNVKGATPHGFRSAFRDWAGDTTPHPRELIEEALAHVVGNAVERAYRRSDALEKRRALMDDWAACLATAPVVEAVSAGVK